MVKQHVVEWMEPDGQPTWQSLCHQDYLTALENAENFCASQLSQEIFWEKTSNKRHLLNSWFLHSMSIFFLFSQTRSIPFPAVQSSLEEMCRPNEFAETGYQSWYRVAEVYELGDYNHVLTLSAVSDQEHLSEATKVMILDIFIDCVKQRSTDSLPNLTSFPCYSTSQVGRISWTFFSRWCVIQWNSHVESVWLVHVEIGKIDCLIKTLFAARKLNW